MNLFGYVKNKPLKHRDPRGLDDADIAFRETEYYKELERRGNEFWKSVRNLPKSPKKPECGPSGQPFREWLVPDKVGGMLGPFGYSYNITPACETHDSCYSTCGKQQEQCDQQLRKDVFDICKQGGGTDFACNFYANGYYTGVSQLGQPAHQSAQTDGACIQCFLPPPPPPPCSRYGDWRCK